MAAAEDGRQALENLHLAAALSHGRSPDPPEASCSGCERTVAGLEQAEWETVYAVTRTWFTVVYAREQERLGAR